MPSITIVKQKTEKNTSQVKKKDLNTENEISYKNPHYVHIIRPKKKLIRINGYKTYYAARSLAIYKLIIICYNINRTIPRHWKKNSRTPLHSPPSHLNVCALEHLGPMSSQLFVNYNWTHVMLLSLQSNLPKQRRNEEALYILCYTNISRRYKMNLMVKEKKKEKDCNICFLY